ncbi:MAG: YebC/PmpR family DNA-binding transcriptional regulator [Christensenellaceae bacterium]
MAGHSKWANIKHKKGKADAARGKIFTKIGREITVAVKEGGADLEMNARLRDAVAKAKMNNMPNDTIQRAIKKASGGDDTSVYEEIVYEGYAPGGVAVIVTALTDNKNRTASDVRHAFDKNGGSLGATGCVAWMFDTKGLILVEKADVDEEVLMMDAIEAGAEDFTAEEEEVYEILAEPSMLTAVRESLERAGYTLASAEIDRIPQNYITPDEETAAGIQKLLDMLEDNDDVQDVFHNAELPEESA